MERALPQIALAMDWIADALEDGGRLIYVGTGTSGRIAALDAAECPPTFGVSPQHGSVRDRGRAHGRWVRRLRRMKIRATLGVREIRKKRVGKKDVVVGISASGRTPFTIAAVEWARRVGAKTIAVTCESEFLA